jgi:hypothetical protein
MQSIFGIAWTILNFVADYSNELFPCLQLFLGEVLGNEHKEVGFVVIYPQKVLPVATCRLLGRFQMVKTPPLSG